MTYPAFKSLLVLLGLAASLAVFFRRTAAILRMLRFPAPPQTFPAGESGIGWHFSSPGAFLRDGIAQQRLFNLAGPGAAHFLIFWAFLFLSLTILQSLAGGLAAWADPHFRLPLITDLPPLALAQDVFALGALGGVLYALDLRLRVKPARYTGSHARQGWLVLVAILLILASLLAMNAAAIRLGEETSAWRPVSAALALLLAPLSASSLSLLHESAYWIHLAVILAFLAELPAGKHLHILTALPSLALRPPQAPGNLPPAPVFDGMPGADRPARLPARSILDFYTCSECGRCQDVCPAWLSGAPLSPKRLMMDLRAALDTPQDRLIGGAVAEETLWACTTCLACQEVCPLFIRHVPVIVQLRRRLAEEGRIPASLQNAFEALAAEGNAFGLARARRAEWAQAFVPPIPDARRMEVEYLWYPGDTASFDPAALPATRRTAELLRLAGVDFGILYEGEQNAGCDARRAGEEGLFQDLRRANLDLLRNSRYRAIVTGDPHTLHTLKTEYGLHPALPVLHVSELLAGLIDAGRLPLRRSLDLTVTYHDPCYLGRYHAIYAAPRRLLEATGCVLVEMAEHGAQTRCCGAGGGRTWMEEGGGRERPTETRLRAAAALPGVSVFATACPKDLVMFREAAQSTGLENCLRVRDICDLLHDAVV